MLTSSLINPVLVSTLPFKLRPLQKLTNLIKPVNIKCSHYSVIIKKFHPHQANFITFLGESACSSSITNKTYTLSRAMSGAGDGGLNINYDGLLDAQKDDKVLIIDVREDAEIQETGKLPGSIHIPMSDVPNVLTNLSSDDFEKKYCKKKPSQETKIVLSCRSGKRSAMVQQQIQKLGYNNAINYTGGWLDWESRQC